MQEKSELSQNKRDFSRVFGGHQLTVNEALRAAKSYREKKGIRIEVQGNYSDPNMTDENAIETIQAQLNEGEYAAYLHMSDKTGDESPHVECAIITKDRIIKPISWERGQRGALDVSRFPKAAVTDLDSLDEIKYRPQSDGESCGSLSLAYAKQLLKDKGHQIKTLTLCIPYIKHGEINYFFVPSPQVLRYSQSGTYNDYLYHLVMHDKPRTYITPKGDVETDTTLRHVLEEAAKNPATQGEATTLLADLPAFRERWKTAFDEMHDKRDRMQKRGLNRQLAYTTRRMQRKAVLAEENQSEAALKLIPTIIERQNRIQNPSKVLHEFSKNMMALFDKSERYIEQIDIAQLAYFVNALSKVIPPEVIVKFLFSQKALHGYFNNPIDYYAFSSLCHKAIRKTLKNELVKSALFKTFFHKNFGAKETLKWIHALGIPEVEAASFIGQFVSKEVFRTALFDYITALGYGRFKADVKENDTFLDYFFEDRKTLAQFSRVFFDEKWLGKQDIANRLDRFKVISETDEAFNLFCDRYFPIEDLVTYTKRSQWFSSDINLYIGQRKKGFRDAILRKPSPVFDALVEGGFSNVAHILSENLDERELTKALIIHQKIWLMKVLERGSIYPLNTDKKLFKAAVSAKFFSYDDPEIFNLYRTKLAQYNPSYSGDKYKLLVGFLIFFPQEERGEFIRKVAQINNEDEIATILSLTDKEIGDKELHSIFQEIANQPFTDIPVLNDPHQNPEPTIQANPEPTSRGLSSFHLACLSGLSTVSLVALVVGILAVVGIIAMSGGTALIVGGSLGLAASAFSLFALRRKTTNAPAGQTKNDNADYSPPSG